MATQVPTIASTPHNSDGSVKIITWDALGSGDDGTPVSVPQWADKTVTINGVLAAATVAIEGSNDKANWHALSDAQGTAISAGCKLIAENPLWIRPKLTGGGVETEIKVIVCVRLPNTLRT